MKVKILGAHQGESDKIRFTSILVDGRLAIDAGGLTASLSLEDQLAIDAALITHQHHDHVKDLPGFMHNRWHAKGLDLYCMDHTRGVLESHVFNDVTWPSMTHSTGSRHPLVFHSAHAGQPLDVLDYEVLPIEVSHTVPTQGYYVSDGKSSFFYTADTRGKGDPPWGHVRPDLLITETTMASEYEEFAHRFGHLTPRSLGGELRAYHERQGYFPRVVCIHINPYHEDRIREEIAALSKELDTPIELGYEGLEIEL
ncbi:MAG TPA: MBL fold metallo-hydrolase [Chloroflexia bacterium]|jgi:ribonuclease BN (tRNA processing enzyme)